MATATTGRSPSQPLVLLIFTFLVLISPWYINQRPYREPRIIRKKSTTSITPAPWLPVLLLLLILAIYLSSCFGESCVSVPTTDSSSIHRVGGSSWGIGALLLMLMGILWWQTTMQESFTRF
eukprot:Gb_03314 [translate_table: standard]